MNLLFKLQRLHAISNKMHHSKAFLNTLLCDFWQVGKIRKTAARKREFHVLFMVITTIICYLICWMPYGVIALLATFGRPGLVSPVASIIPSILAKSSTVYNPIIYILMNKQVRTTIETSCSVVKYI